MADFKYIFFLEMCGIAFFLYSCGTSRNDIRETISKHSGLDIPEKFDIIRDCTATAPTAFDSDYQLFLTLKFENDEKRTLINDIRELNFVDSLLWENTSEEPIWCRSENSYRFLQPVSVFQDRIYMHLDTITNQLHFQLTHN